MIDFHIINKANVYLRNLKTGTLIRKESGCIFQYDKDYINNPASIPVSFSLPLKTEEFVSEKNLLPFFDNLILEGWLLNVSEKTLKIEKSDKFSLLMATGLDTIGAVEVRGLYDGKEIQKKDFADYYNLEGFEGYELKNNFQVGVCPLCLDDISGTKEYHPKCIKALWGFDENPNIVLKSDDFLYSFRMTIFGKSISGAQRKSIFAVDRKSKTLRPDLMNSTHIVKPQGDYAELPENEHLSMAIAKKLMFDVPPIGLFYTEGLGNIFVIKRFDRVKNEKLHFEEFAMLANQESANKYLSSCEKLAKILQLYSEAPSIQMYEFFRRILFCYITANGDMHLKNWGLLEDINQKGVYKLAPVYDFLNTRIPIPNELDDIGLPLNGKKRNLNRKDFIVFAEEKLFLNKKIINKLFEEIPEWKKVIYRFIDRSELKSSSCEKYYNLANARIKILFS